LAEAVSEVADEIAPATGSTPSEVAVDFMYKVLKTLGFSAEITATVDDEEGNIYLDITGDDMGTLIGKRGQTLDALQYLTSLVVNRACNQYYKIKLDTENYRARRKETLENLARNIASKVKRTRRNVALEPMNPYERRIIHAALQNDKYVETHSEGEEPYRKVIVTMKKGVVFEGGRGNYGRNGYGIPVFTYEELAGLVLGYDPWDLGLQLHQVAVEPLLNKMGVEYDPKAKYLGLNKEDIMRPEMPNSIKCC
jgi:spoIIIJ-associated protein